jgi:hypothetical protein
VAGKFAQQKSHALLIHRQVHCQFRKIERPDEVRLHPGVDVPFDFERIGSNGLNFGEIARLPALR